MTVVDFDQIIKLGPERATRTSPVEISLGPISAGGTRTTLYDPAWGYFLFGQNVRCDYVDQETYFDVADFTINGVFTVHAENAKTATTQAQQSSTLTDDQSFLKVTAAFTALEAMFDAAAKAAAPAAYEQWGTASDPRCIPLPFPLLNKAGGRIYALPVELTVEPGQWGKYIRYRATLHEAKFPPGKVLVNGKLLDGGLITITLPAPILSRSMMAGCSGEVIEVRNYTCPVVEVQGTVSGPLPTGNRTITDAAHDLMTSLATDNVDVGIVRLANGTVVQEVLWPGAALDEGAGVDISFDDETCSVALRARPTKV